MNYFIGEAVIDFLLEKKVIPPVTSVSSTIKIAFASCENARGEVVP